MSTATSVEPAPTTTRLRPGLVWLLALACGLVVANLYYNQPVLAAIGREFGVKDSRASLIATATQAGYTLGMLLLVPLGDKLERKRFILWLLAGAALCLAGAALAPSFAVLALASTLLGLCSAVPQLLLPLAASLAPEAERGRILGRIMSGLLLGILLSRTISGFVAAHLGGWRVVFGGASGVMLALAALLAWQLPRNHADFRGTYAELLRSLGTLVRTQPALRRSAVVGMLAFGSFSVFWTTLAFYLGSPAHGYGSDVVGLFGIVGAAGALAAPWAGKTADRRGPRYTITVGIVLALAAYLVLGLAGGWLLGLVLGVLLLDVGVQAAHTSNQALVFSLIPEARSRLNTVYMTAYFTGGSLGSLAGGWAWAHYGWPGVCAVGGSLVAGALAVHRLGGR